MSTASTAGSALINTAGVEVELEAAAVVADDVVDSLQALAMQITAHMAHKRNDQISLFIITPE